MHTGLVLLLALAAAAHIVGGYMIYKRIKELEKKNQQTQRFAGLGALVAGMVHEIKNPLVSIQTFAELLPEKYDDPEFRHKFSCIVLKEIERINQLIMELMRCTRNPRPIFSEVEVKVLVEEIAALLSHQLNAQRVRLCRSYSRDLPSLKADKNQLKQALLNICLNGMQAMPGGGKLWVEALSPAAQEKSLKIPGPAVAERRVIIRIRDTGTGIDSRQKERIFEPFFTTKGEGMGIGLNISRRIIAAHGGSLHFQSGRWGTVFEICLPAAADNKEPVDCLTDRFLKKGSRKGKGEAAI